jgi:methionine-gamma-lyase
MSRLDRTQTLAVHGGDALNGTAAVPSPIWQSATFRTEGVEHFAQLSAAVNPSEMYTRYGNPNQAQAAQMIASLEGAEAGLVTSAGVGAIATVLFTYAKQGDHVIAQRDLYAMSTVLLRDFLGQWGVDATFVDQTDIAAFAAAVRPNTKLIFLESPSNPLLKITDLPAVADIARPHGITTAIDATFGTPINQRTLSFGIDIAVHSATKYLGGHSDVSAGAIVSTQARIATMWRTLVALGAVLSPFDSWLLQRGLRTLPLRMRQHNTSAMALAAALEAHPNVAAVNYPGLGSHPQYELARQQMQGFGGVLSFEVAGGYESAVRCVRGLRMATYGASLGGTHTLVVHPASMWVQQQSTVEPALIRVGVGLEDTEDIIADFETALWNIR